MGRTIVIAASAMLGILFASNWLVNALVALMVSLSLFHFFRDDGREWHRWRAGAAWALRSAQTRTAQSNRVTR